VSAALGLALAAALLTGGPGPHALNLSVATDTLPGTSAMQYRVPESEPVVVRYTLVNTSEASVLNLHVDDPEVPPSAITCAGGTALLPPLATRQCTATIPAGDGRRVRTILATGTLAWFGTRATASTSTGYVGYQAALTVHELVAGASTDPSKPDALVVGDSVDISYQITNTGDVPLSGLTLRSSLDGAGCSPGGQLLPGEQVSCTLTPRATDGLHVDDVAVSGTPQVTVLSGDGELVAAPAVSASGQGAYLGVAAGSVAGASGSGGRGRAGGHADGLGSRALGTALGTLAGKTSGGRAAAGGSGAGGSSGTGGSTGTGGSSGADVGSATKGGSSAAQPVPLQRAGAGFAGLMKHARKSLPWLMVIFLVVLVPLIVRLARVNRSTDG
jgi:hypothetical protein